MVRVEGEITIERPIEEVFDFVADESNEPKYNPRMTRADKITPGPVGEGTRFNSVMRTCSITGGGRDGGVFLEIVNDGAPATTWRGSGLAGLSERVRSLSGSKEA